MTPATGRASSRRLLAMAIVALLFAPLLLAKYRQPDTATLQIVAHALTSPAGADSALYMNMGEAAFRGPGHRIFPKLFFEEHQKFIYPPSSLFLIEALNLTASPDKARFALLLLSWLGTLIVAVFFFREMRGSVTALEAASIVLLGILFLPIAEALYRGQIQILLTFLWGFAALLWQRERRGWAGFVLALTCAFKPQLALFLFWGALRKEWRFTSIFAATLAVISACSIARFGLQNNFDYFVVLTYLSHHGEALWANQSMNGLLNRLLRNGDPTGWSATVYPPYRTSIYILSTAFMLLGVLIGLLLPWRKNWAATTADFLFFGGISVIISPIAWEHHYGVFFFLLAFLLARAESLTKTRWFLLAACTLAMANRLPPLDHRLTGLPALLGGYLFYAGLTVLALLALAAGSPKLAAET
jgi:alpha-1,2-mannosyltransferase